MPVRVIRARVSVYVCVCVCVRVCVCVAYVHSHLLSQRKCSTMLPYDCVWVELTYTHLANKCYFFYR
jgi:hypothetical protein